MPFPFAALAAVGGLAGSYINSQNQPQQPQFTPFQSPFAAQRDAEIRRLLSGQLSPAERGDLAKRRKDAITFLQQRSGTTPSGGFARNLGQVDERLGQFRQQLLDRNKQFGLGLAGQQDALGQQQNQFGFQQQMANYQQQLAQNQQTSQGFGNIGAAGLRSLFTQQGGGFPSTQGLQNQVNNLPSLPQGPGLPFGGNQQAPQIPGLF
jgi:hypothetical protein